MKLLKISESGLHRAVADLLDLVLLPPALWTTFPAGWGKLGKAVAGRLHGAGLKPGMPDILCFFAGRCIGIELKTKNGRLSRQQEAMHDRLAEAGVPVYVCHDIGEVMATLRYARFPVRQAEIAA